MVYSCYVVNIIDADYVVKIFTILCLHLLRSLHCSPKTQRTITVGPKMAALKKKVGLAFTRFKVEPKTP